jgi:hypothetical protein
MTKTPTKREIRDAHNLQFFKWAFYVTFGILVAFLVALFPVVYLTIWGPVESRHQYGETLTFLIVGSLVWGFLAAIFGAIYSDNDV